MYRMTPSISRHGGLQKFIENIETPIFTENILSHESGEA